MLFYGLLVMNKIVTIYSINNLTSKNHTLQKERARMTEWNQMGERPPAPGSCTNGVCIPH